MQRLTILSTALLTLFATTSLQADSPQSWTVDTTDQWKQAQSTSSNLTFEKGQAVPTDKQASFQSIVKTFDHKHQPARITFTQSPAWDNWKPIKNVAPENTANAPVFLPVAPGNYWYFAARKGQRGYHAWHSTDLKTWTHHGRISQSHWVTTAEYADGKTYIYYDEPNDEDPHLILYDDIAKGKGRDLGEVFSDPSPGSDAGIFRDEDGTFHLIYEDWTPINARRHSWDSPLAGHADSSDGIHGFEPHENPAPIDVRTTPTGKTGTYNHPSTGENEFQIHEGPQDAFGDYTLIKVGSRYYIFCDYDPHDARMRVGRWTSDDINKPFTFAGDVGKGFHPDPTIGFAEGRFYLLVQRNAGDFVSPGPWVDNVQARVGADINGDGNIDQWTKWQKVTERYSQNPGFARIVETPPAALDLSELPKAPAFQFEFKTQDTTKNKSQPILDNVTLSFK